LSVSILNFNFIDLVLNSVDIFEEWNFTDLGQ